MKQKIEYPSEIIEGIKKCYDSDFNMLQLAHNGNLFLGRWLDDGSNDVIELDDIINASSFRVLRQKAIDLKAKRELYYLWCNWYNDYMKKNPA